MNKNIDIERLMDNAATAAQCRELCRNDSDEETPLREAVRRNVADPLQARLATAEAERDEARRERDAYCKAKQENDERFMLERDTARQAAKAAEEQLAQFKTAVTERLHLVRDLCGGMYDMADIIIDGPNSRAAIERETAEAIAAWLDVLGGKHTEEARAWVLTDYGSSESARGHELKLRAADIRAMVWRTPATKEPT